MRLKHSKGKSWIFQVSSTALLQNPLTKCCLELRDGERFCSVSQLQHCVLNSMSCLFTSSPQYRHAARKQRYPNEVTCLRPFKHNSARFKNTRVEFHGGAELQTVEDVLVDGVELLVAASHYGSAVSSALTPGPGLAEPSSALSCYLQLFPLSYF